jgi:hypothetical protein
MTDKQPVASEERNESKIYLIRGHNVMLSMHLAAMHRIKPQALEQAIERNIERFPEGSMFRLNSEEIAGLKLPVALLEQVTPYVFTAEGVVILSSVLFDEREIHENRKSRSSTCTCPR